MQAYLISCESDKYSSTAGNNRISIVKKCVLAVTQQLWKHTHMRAHTQMSQLNKTMYGPDQSFKGLDKRQLALHWSIIGEKLTFLRSMNRTSTLLIHYPSSQWSTNSCKWLYYEVLLIIYSNTVFCFPFLCDWYDNFYMIQWMSSPLLLGKALEMLVVFERAVLLMVHQTEVIEASHITFERQ